MQEKDISPWESTSTFSYLIVWYSCLTFSVKRAHILKAYMLYATVNTVCIASFSGWYHALILCNSVDGIGSHAPFRPTTWRFHLFFNQFTLTVYSKCRRIKGFPHVSLSLPITYNLFDMFVGFLIVLIKSFKTYCVRLTFLTFVRKMVVVFDMRGSSWTINVSEDVLHRYMDAMVFGDSNKFYKKK